MHEVKLFSSVTGLDGPLFPLGTESEKCQIAVSYFRNSNDFQPVLIGLVAVEVLMTRLDVLLLLFLSFGCGKGGGVIGVIGG